MSCLSLYRRLTSPDLHQMPSSLLVSLITSGKTVYRDLVRLGVLLVAIGGLVATAKYGLPKL